MIADIIVRILFASLLIGMGAWGFWRIFPGMVKDYRTFAPYSSRGANAGGIAVLSFIFMVFLGAVLMGAVISRTKSRFHPDIVKKENERKLQEAQRVLQEAAAKSLVPNLQTCPTCGDIHKCK